MSAPTVRVVLTLPLDEVLTSGLDRIVRNVNLESDGTATRGDVEVDPFRGRRPIPVVGSWEVLHG